MSTPPAGLGGRIQHFLTYFQRGSLDIPDGLIARGCVFRLNGAAYEDSLGRSTRDPLTRLLGRGPAACRFIAQGLRYAVPDLVVEVHDLSGDDRGGLVTGRARLSGTPRAGATGLRASADVALVTDAGGAIVEVAVRIDEEVVQALAIGGR